MCYPLVNVVGFPTQTVPIVNSKPPLSVKTYISDQSTFNSFHYSNYNHNQYPYDGYQCNHTYYKNKYLVYFCIHIKCAVSICN